AYPLSRELNWRMRAELSNFLNDGVMKSRGYLLYTDFNYKPMGAPISFTSRVAYFQTDDYDSRIYAYENNLLYTFGFPAYYATGVRTYLNARWRVTRSMTFEARYALTYRPYEESISSSYSKYEGNKIHEFKAQLRLRF